MSSETSSARFLAVSAVEPEVSRITEKRLRSSMVDRRSERSFGASGERSMKMDMSKSAPPLPRAFFVPSVESSASSSMELAGCTFLLPARFIRWRSASRSEHRRHFVPMTRPEALNDAFQFSVETGLNCLHPLHLRLSPREASAILDVAGKMVVGREIVGINEK